MEVKNKFITIKGYISGNPSETDLEVTSTTLSLMIEEGSRDIIVKNLYLSIDPYQINRMKNHSSSHRTVDFAAKLVPGQEISSFGVGIIVASGNPDYAKGDFVAGLLTWAEFTVVQPGTIINKISGTEFPLSYHLGALGTSGFTAYGGFYSTCEPKKGDRVFVSAASGSVGNLVGQFAKLHGCYVVGCAGSKKKVFISSPAA